MSIHVIASNDPVEAGATFHAPVMAMIRRRVKKQRELEQIGIGLDILIASVVTQTLRELMKGSKNIGDVIKEHETAVRAKMMRWKPTL